MPKPREEYLHILVRSRAWLEPLNMMGPIVHPLKVNKKTVVRLLLSSCEVIEWVPETKNTIVLTLKNINDDSRYTEADKTSLKKSLTPVKPVKNEGIETNNQKSDDDKSPLGGNWKSLDKELFTEDEIKASQEKVQKIAEETGLNANPNDKITKNEADKINAEKYAKTFSNTEADNLKVKSAEAPAEPETLTESKEQVVETEVKSEDTQTVDGPKEDDIIANYPLEVKEGKVDESNIDWNQFTKAQRRALRARINELNASVN